MNRTIATALERRLAQGVAGRLTDQATVWHPTTADNGAFGESTVWTATAVAAAYLEPITRLQPQEREQGGGVHGVQYWRFHLAVGTIVQPEDRIQYGGTAYTVGATLTAVTPAATGGRVFEVAGPMAPATVDIACLVRVTEVR